MGWIRALAGAAIAIAAGAATTQTMRTPPDLQGAPPIRREFREWLLVCDNVLVCRAQPRGVGNGSLMIRRDPGPDSRLLVVLDGQDPAPESSVPANDSILVDGAPADRSLPWQLDLGAEHARLEGAPALRFVRSIADARVLSYRTGAETLDVPLTGLKAALLAMDDHQGRVGTATAFTRPGTRPISQVRSAPALPIVRAVPAPSAERLPDAFARRVRAASGAWLADCPEPQTEGDAAWPLTATDAIVMLACGTGTHSTSYLLVRAAINGSPRVRRIVLPSPPRREEEAQYEEALYSDVDWNGETGTLYSSGYSCAHTCGENSQWVFDGRDFVLAEHFIYEWGGAEVLYLYRTDVQVRH